MIATYIIIGVLLFISSVSKAIMDTLQFHFETSVFKNLGSWWNPSSSWENKYKWFPNSKILTWIFSSPLVLFTDAWHFFGFIRDFTIFACIPVASGKYLIILAYLFWALIFHVFFTYIFPKK
jgi:hypothetical protein